MLNPIATADTSPGLFHLSGGARICDLHKSYLQAWADFEGNFKQIWNNALEKVGFSKDQVFLDFLPSCSIGARVSK